MERGHKLPPIDMANMKKTEGVLFGIKIPQRPDSLIPIKSPDIKTSPQDYVWAQTTARLLDFANGLTSREGPSTKIEEPPENIGADLAFATHPFASVLKKSPKDIADDALVAFDKSKNNFPYLVNPRQEGPYVNFDIEPTEFGNAVIEQVEDMGDLYGDQNIGNGENVVLDVSSPNIAKFMSIGHLRSTAIGESLARIYRSLGYTSIRDNHIGDWGTQFGMLGAAYKRWGEEIPELQSANEQEVVKGLYELYVRMNQEIEAEKAKKAEAEGVIRGREKGKKTDVESDLEKEGREWFKKLEEGDKEAIEMWQWALNMSLREFNRVYNLLGVEFEYMIGESFYTTMLPSVVESLLKSDVATRDESGAVIVQFDEEGEDKMVFQKSDGTSLYQTRDMAGLAARTAWFDPAKILYVVGGEQKHYFKQVFETFRRLAEDADLPNIEHVYFGMMRLPEGGKMSTRKGNVIFLEELLQRAVDTAREKILDNNPDMSEKGADAIARKVGIGAIIYFDLGQGRNRDIDFDWDEALSFEGTGAPYIQYAYTRAKSIIEKAKEQGIEISDDKLEFGEKEEKDLLKQIAKLPGAIKKAAENNQPSDVAEYVFQAAQLFNQFYRNVRVLNADTDQQKSSRLRLTRAAAITIKKALYLLGIDVPDRM